MWLLEPSNWKIQQQQQKTSWSPQREPTQTATGTAALQSFIYLFIFGSLEDGRCVRLRSPPGNLCQKKCTYLFSVHSLPYLPLRKEGSRDASLNWGCLSAVTLGWRSSVSKSFSDKRAENASACCHRTQASDVLYSSPTRLRQRGYVFCFFFQWEGATTLFLFAVTEGLQTRERDNIVFAHVWGGTVGKYI